MAEYDLVLTGGRVIDPAEGCDGPADVAFAGGRVAAVGPGLAGGAAEVRDVTGLIVTPGLIDLHTHVYWGGTSISVAPDAYARASAVSTLVDTGSAGPGNFEGFRRHVIDHATARILVYLHISHAGIYAFSPRVMVGESEDMRLMDPDTGVEVVEAHRDVIIGIKVRLGRWTSGVNGMRPFEAALALAERTGLHLMVHIDEPPPTYDEIVAALRPGDVLTHCFRPAPNAPMTDDGRVRESVRAARARGVIFDIGHGYGSFAFEVARRMLAEGFAPDTISSDIHVLCIEGPVFDQVTTLTKFLALGMPLGEVIAASTVAPARAIGRPDLGTLRPGAAGDASILGLEDGRFELVDAVGETLTARNRLAARGLVIGGRWIG